MVNSEQFAKRLQKILEFYDVSAATFAETIDVGRSSISHILSGRNKPSLEFVMKIVKTYPEVELYWLLNGKGSFPPRERNQPEENISQQDKIRTILSQPVATDQIYHDIPDNSEKLKSKLVKKVILLFEDGTFETFENLNSN